MLKLVLLPCVRRRLCCPLDGSQRADNLCFGRSCAESALAPSGLNAANGESAQSSRLELGGPASCPHFLSACAHRLCKADTTWAGRTQPAQLWPPSCAAVSAAPAVSAGRCVRTAAAALMRTQLRLRRCTMHCAAAAAAQLCRPQSGAISKGTTTYAIVHCLNIFSAIYKFQKNPGRS